jgi:hypothetical protein
VCAIAASPFSTSVVSYNPGSNPISGYTNPLAALGEPTRYTGVGVFPGAVTPFNPPFLPSEIVSIGEGGDLTLRFDQPVTHDPRNPYGIDLLIFGNCFYKDLDYPNGVAGDVISAGHGLVQVSADGAAWFNIPGAPADAPFPTLGYSDLTDPYSTVPGNVLSDFTRPVNPAFDPKGHTFSEIVAAYAGSGGGSGVDIGPTGLSAIQYVRIVNPVGSGATVEIDAVSDVSPVPGPGACVVFGAAALSYSRRRR